jgi:transcriptional regulator with XRE-family HTH domain
VIVNLPEERLNRGLSVRAAAKEIGVGADVLARAEEGTMPRPAAALKIATYYGYKVTEVWPLEKEAA